jgi:hypothetical protein
VEATVTLAATIPDGGTGFLPVGAKSVYYYNNFCTGSTRLRAVAAVADTTGDGNWDQSDEGSAGLGCLEPFGASVTPNVGVLFLSSLPVISSASVYSLRMLQGINELTLPTIGQVVENIPFFQSWAQLAQMSQDAADASVVDDPGFTQEQFEEFLDPDGDFHDFDIPPTP